MRRFTLVGLTLVLLTGSASAQTVYKMTTFTTSRGKTTIIEPAGQPQSGKPDPKGLAYCFPMGLLRCLLPDQPALLDRLAMMSAAHTALLDDKKPAAEEKKVDEKKDGKEIVPDLPPPATMIALNPILWDNGCRFTDDRKTLWCLVKGCPRWDAPGRMRGWLLESAAKKVYFVDSTGNIYRRMGVAP